MTLLCINIPPFVFRKVSQTPLILRNFLHGQKRLCIGRKAYATDQRVCHPLQSAQPSMDQVDVAGHVPGSSSTNTSHLTQGHKPETEIHNDNATEVGAKSGLSRRAQKRILRRQRLQERLADKKQAKKLNKSSSPSKELDSLNDEYLNETSYYFEKGLRKVYPYYFKFCTYAKGRWYGRSLLDVFSEEFEANTMGNLKEKIESGGITVNGDTVQADYKLKDNDFVENTMHRHEVAVTAEPIEIIEDSHDFLVVNKPSSVPIHPCGRYRHNSLTFILAKEYGYQNLRTSYRLDRLTSGVFILCKTETKNQELQGDIKQRRVQKEYVCRVGGVFPEGEVECSEPIDYLSRRLGLFKVGSGGKEAKTTFEKLSCHGNTSVVICRPLTGRTHQIRVHLQYLGYPIVNDPLYNTEIWGPERGKGGHYGKPEEQLVEELLAYHKADKFQSNSESNSKDIMPASANQHVAALEGATCEHSDSKPKSDASDVPSTNCGTNSAETAENLPCKRLKLDHSNSGSTSCDTRDSHTERAREERALATAGDSAFRELETGSSLQRPQIDPAKMTFDPKCPECLKEYMDPRPKDLVMFLHAYKYKGPKWEFSTPLPAWAKEDLQPS